MELLAYIGYTAIAQSSPPPSVNTAISLISKVVPYILNVDSADDMYSPSPVEKLGIRVKDDNVYTDYDAVKYTRGMNVGTIEHRPFLKDKYVDVQSFPYDSYKED